jgi:4-hydroxy-3-methylbut-2-enyl diphosphate reductase
MQSSLSGSRRSAGLAADAAAFRVLTAESMGMCFGVRDALSLALDHPRRADLTVLGDLVHNPTVLRRLEEAGIRRVASLEAPVATLHVLVTAHGASEAALARLRARGLTVLEATCPLVRHAHRMVRRLVARGYFPAIIGQPDHVEVRGLTEDLDECAVLRGPEDLGLLAGRARIGVASQTTQPLAFVLEMVDRIRAAYPDAEVRFADTVCQPTKDRQEAARRLAASCEVVVVVGGRHSNNTRQLLAACRREGARAHQVEGPAELRREWFRGASRVGLTAGTSTPEEVIQAVHAALCGFAGG